MNKKRILTIVILLVLLSGATAFFYFRASGPPRDSGSAFPSKPTFPNYVKETLSVKSAISKENFNFPERLPLVLIESAPALTEEEVLQTANRAGFPKKDYLAVNDIKRGKTYIFKEGLSSLTVYAQGNEVVYVSGSEPTVSPPSPPEEALISSAERFLKENLLPEGESVFFSSVNYLREDGEGLAEVQKNEANIIKVNFSPVEAEIKFVGTNPLSSALSVWLDPLGLVIKAEAKRVASARISPEEVLIKTYDEFNTSVSSAVLVSLADGNLFPGDFSEEEIGEISVLSAELAYYQGGGRESFYQPVFLLKGTARLQGFGSLPAILYLPATRGL